MPLRLPRLLLLALVALLALTALVTGRGGSASALGSSTRIDPFVPYDGQTTCTSSPQIGTVVLARYLMRAYPGTGSLGMMRACGSGGRSEHKDGRAFDWKADVRKKRQRRAAYAFIARAIATDAAGNRAALARRMGIMYLIYDDKIWSASHGFAVQPYRNAACLNKPLRKCSRSLRHKNHVHISLGLAGAAAQTSWYRAQGIASKPVLHPGTTDLDADQTAVTGLTVPANGAVVVSPYTLRPGVTYRLVATGWVRNGTAYGDAQCSTAPAWTPTPRGEPVDPVLQAGTWTQAGPWHHEGSTHRPSPYALPTVGSSGVLANTALRWEGGCTADHTYEAWYTPATRQHLVLQYADANHADDTGTITVYVARDDITRGSLVRK